MLPPEQLPSGAVIAAFGIFVAIVATAVGVTVPYKRHCVAWTPEYSWEAKTKGGPVERVRHDYCARSE